MTLLAWRTGPLWYTTVDRYQRVEKATEETPINENEIRITSQGRMRNYITYATTLLQEKGLREIVLKAMGRAINKCVMIAEMIKRRIAGLHQNISIGSTDITYTWEPLEGGLLTRETTRHVSMITITLSKEVLDGSSKGDHLPLPGDQVKPWTEFEYNGKAHLLVCTVEDVVVKERVVEEEAMVMGWSQMETTFGIADAHTVAKVVVVEGFTVFAGKE
ncbi:hypothetical protein AAC387_Pa12g0890 [Persea americana]